MNIRQWIGFIFALAGGWGVTQKQGIEYLTASIMILVVGCLLWFIPQRKKRK